MAVSLASAPARSLPAAAAPPLPAERSALLSAPKRVLDAALEIPKAMGRGALAGVAVIGLPAVLVPPLLPLFAPFIPLAAAVGSAQGFFTGTVNALGRLAEGDEFKPLT